MTLPAQDIVERLRKAMDGVTPGRWERFPSDHIAEVGGGRFGVQSNKGPIVADCGEVMNIYSKANAVYIALCSPDNIGALLDTISRLTADNEALRKDRDEEARCVEYAEGDFQKAIVRAESAEAQLEEMTRSCLAEREGRLAAEARVSALSAEVERLRETLRAVKQWTLFELRGNATRQPWKRRLDHIDASLNGGSDHG